LYLQTATHDEPASILHRGPQGDRFSRVPAGKRHITTYRSINRSICPYSEGGMSSRMLRRVAW
jgi:hypothetical protein